MYAIRFNKNTANQVQFKAHPACSDSGLIGFLIGVVMKRIPLTKGKFAIVDDEDYEELNKYNWRAVKSRNTWYAYRYVWLPNNKVKAIAMHRQILKAPKGLEVDHKNFDGLCNRRDNIRKCTTSQNQAHRKPFKRLGTSIYKGVSWNAGHKKWYVQVNAKNISHRLGCYDSEKEAARVYDKRAIELFGDFALTNAELYDEI